MKNQESSFSKQDRLKLLSNIIYQRKSLSELGKIFNVPLDQILNEIIILMRSGRPITKAHLNHLSRVTEELFKLNITCDDLQNSENLSVIKAKCCENKKITDAMAKLVWNYLKIRNYLDILEIPYYDPDENKLMKVNSLLDGAVSSVADSCTNCPKTTREFLQQFNHFEKSPMKTEPTKSDSFEDDPALDQYLADFDYLECNNGSIEKLNEKENLPSTSKTNSINLPSTSKIVTTSSTNSEKNNANSTGLPIVNKATSVKKCIVKPASKVVYCNSDSESDTDNDNETKKLAVKRALPQWLSTNKNKIGNSIIPNKRGRF